jgi:hypothetical protein
MDDFGKQKANEEKYKQLRSQPAEEYVGNFESPHFQDVKQQGPAPSHIVEKENFSTTYLEDFDSAAKDFWQKNTQSGVASYNGGSLTANFGKEEYTVDELLERIGKFVKESITNELSKKKIPTETLTENFKAIDVSLKLLALSVSQLDEKMDPENVTAYLHGFINTYVSNTIRRKIERDKNRVAK